MATCSTGSNVVRRVAHSWTASATVTLAWALVAGCPDTAGPEVVADAFVDAYYVEFDLVRAQTFADGPARRRLEAEAALVADARRKTDVQEAKARVYYSSPERREVSADKVHFRYALDVRRGSDKLTRATYVLVGKRDGRWTVVQFGEEGASGRPPE